MQNLLSDKLPELKLDLEPHQELALPPSSLSAEAVMQPLMKVFDYVRERNYEGVDLFDGLNSRIFKSLPIYKSRIFRLALIQLCKQSPWNFRSLIMVPDGFNPKGGALFLMGNLNLLRHTGKAVYENEAYILYQRLKRECILKGLHRAWGYNFDWQARAFFVPKGTPNLVTSVYAGRAMLDYHQQFGDAEALEMSLGVAHFILDNMVKYEDERFLCFNYIPGKDAEVHNANLLGASYLAQTLQYMHRSEQETIRNKILKSVRFSMLDINPDGAWPYGTKPFHRWVDNFHTAFNIESLIYISNHLGTDELVPVLKQVIDYYLAHLFTEEGLPKYYNNQLYPIDIHVIAETIVLFQLLRKNGLIWDLERISQIETQLLQLIGEFQDEQGYFYYQKYQKRWNRIPYIRWGQAWMFFALSHCL
jgi:polysaccharide biosynthesis protein VpsJ